MAVPAVKPAATIEAPETRTERPRRQPVSALALLAPALMTSWSKMSRRHAAHNHRTVVPSVIGFFGRYVPVT